MTGDRNADRRPDPVELSLLRGAAMPRMAKRPISRRGLLRGVGTLAGAGAAAAVLAGCGIRGTDQDAALTQGIDWATWWDKQKVHGHFTFDNWAAYIDADNHGNHPTLEMFTKATGIQVTYDDAAIVDNSTYYGKISPLLAAGKSTGADLMVISQGWQFTELVQHGWVAELDHSRMPNFMRYADASAASPSYDFDALHSAIWQSGYTGIAYHADMLDAGTEITSWTDLTKPEFKGKVTMLDDLDELSEVGLLVNGVNPPESTARDWRAAAKWLIDDLGPNVTKYYDQGYLDAFKSKQMPITQAYSGDILAILDDFPDVKFVFPTEGFGMWHDNMMIPVTAQNPLDALRWIDFYYTPKIAALVEDYIWYVSPVDGVRQYIGNVIGDTEYADSPLAYPSKSVLARVHDYANLTTRAQYDTYTSIFQPVVQGS